VTALREVINDEILNRGDKKNRALRFENLFPKPIHAAIRLPYGCTSKESKLEKYRHG
jgi:hypothetical protein